MQDELIRRSDALKAIGQILEAIQAIDTEYATVPEYVGIRKAIKKAGELKEMLEKLPAVQPEPPWITCDQKLPDYGYQVLVSLYDSTDVAHRVAATMPGIEEDSWMSPYGYKIEPEYVEAWMPFPRPYDPDGGGGA